MRRRRFGAGIARRTARAVPDEFAQVRYERDLTVGYRLKVERGYTGGYTMVKDAVQKWKAVTKEVFVPLSHPPGEAQVQREGPTRYRSCGSTPIAPAFR